MQQIETLEEAQGLALAIVDAIIDPYVVLDGQMRLVAASRSFYQTFLVAPDHARGRSLYEVGDGVWDILAVRELLASVLADNQVVEGFELKHTFGALGERTLLLNVRLVPLQSAGSTILLAIKDITARRRIESEKQTALEASDELLRQQRILLKEMQHRVANTLQIIASILMLKARSVGSQETRHELIDAQRRVLSVAQVQSHLHSVDGIEQIDMRAYLTKLCDGLASSMIGTDRPIAIDVESTESPIGSAHAVSLGLIVTELVINAVKYAFPEGRPDACVVVRYSVSGGTWNLTVSDNGIGKDEATRIEGGGLGTAIVGALAKQLKAEISAVSSSEGLSVSVVGPEQAIDLPLAA